MEPVSLGYETTSRGCELEGPQESVDLLEVGADCEDFVDDVLSSMNTQVTKLLGDHLVVGKRDS